MTDIPRLIEKLEAATEGSITLDVEVLNACGFGSSDQFPTHAGEWLQPTQRTVDALILYDRVAPQLVPDLPHYDTRRAGRWPLLASTILLNHIHNAVQEVA